MKKTVLVTGGVQGIGAAISRAFYRAGYNVAINFNSSTAVAAELEKELCGAAVYRADISDEAAVKNMMTAAEAHFGQIDVLVNNAGICIPALIDEISLDDWEKTFAVNVRGTFLCTKHCIPSMIRRKAGCIVNISSIWGISGAAAESCYSASKGATIAFTKACAKELGPSGIRVNAIAPGFIDTKMNADISAEDRRAFCEQTPLMRIGTPEEVAAAVLFLASDGAAFVTGQIIGCDGGCIL